MIQHTKGLWCKACGRRMGFTFTPQADEWEVYCDNCIRKLRWAIETQQREVGIDLYDGPLGDILWAFAEQDQYFKQQIDESAETWGEEMERRGISFDDEGRMYIHGVLQQSHTE